MIRLLIFSLIRFFIAALVIYFVLTFVKGILRVLKGSSSRPFSHPAEPQAPPKPKENYKDVQDAKFVELPDKQEEVKPESDT
jgi:flagellar basal body-associated protein FliL